MKENFRLGALFKFGIVAEVDSKRAWVRVTLPDADHLMTPWLPVLQAKTLRDKSYCLPDVGEHVAVLLDARVEEGVVLGALYSTVDLPPIESNQKSCIRFEDGAQIEYDREQHELKIQGGVKKILIEAQAELVLKAGEKLILEVPDAELHGNLTVHKTLTCSGAATINGTISASDLKVQGRSFLLHSHSVVPNNVTTGPPNII